MEHTLIEIKSQEFQNVLIAYNTIGNYIEKYMPFDEIYNQDFLDSMNEKTQLKGNDLKLVESFDDFIK